MYIQSKFFLISPKEKLKPVLDPRQNPQHKTIIYFINEPLQWTSLAKAFDSNKSSKDLNLSLIMFHIDSSLKVDLKQFDIFF